MESLNVMGRLHDVLADIGALNRQVFGATRDEKIKSQFDVIHESLVRCRDLIRATAVIHSHDCSLALHAAAPALIAIHPDPNRDRDSVALVRSHPTGSGEDYVPVTLPELRMLLENEQAPEFAVPSHFFRQALRCAGPTVTSHEAMKQALDNFLNYCGATDYRTLATTLLNATVANRLASSVFLVLPMAVRSAPAPARIVALVRDAFPSAARLYGNAQLPALTDNNGTAIALPDAAENKIRVADFAKRHGVDFAPLWALHLELRGSDELHDGIWEIA